MVYYFLCRRSAARAFLGFGEPINGTAGAPAALLMGTLLVGIFIVVVVVVVAVAVAIDSVAFEIFLLSGDPPLTKTLLTLTVACFFSYALILLSSLSLARSALLLIFPDLLCSFNLALVNCRNDSFLASSLACSSSFRRASPIAR